MRRRLIQAGATALLSLAADAWLWVYSAPRWTFAVTPILIGIAVSELGS